MVLLKHSRYFGKISTLLAIAGIFVLTNIYLQLRQTIYFQLEIGDDFNDGKWRNLQQEQLKNLSNLGRILFLDENPKIIESSSVPYKILIWKHGPVLAKRHIRNQSNPFQYCAMQNCVLTYDDADIDNADLVVFHLHRTRDVEELPARTAGCKQLWVFLTDESPYNTFMHRKNNDIKSYNGIFNWSMSYRMISDIPVPYGRTIPLKNTAKKINIQEWNQRKNQDVLVAIMISNCNKKRLTYVRQLRNYIQVDVYGRCGNLNCPGHFHTDCDKLTRYKFYLSFENSNCDEYITEKVWWNGYYKNSIPVIMGGSKVSLQQNLPPKSYVDVNDFQSPKHLAEYLLKLNASLDELATFFEWKSNFEVLNEHGYFQSRSVHYCRLCEALHYNNKQTKIYNHIEDYFSLEQCR